MDIACETTSLYAVTWHILETDKGYKVYNEKQKLKGIFFKRSNALKCARAFTSENRLKICEHDKNGNIKKVYLPNPLKILKAK